MKLAMFGAVMLVLVLVLAGADADAKGGHGKSGPSGTKANSGGSHAIRGHVKKDGTYVAPTRATNPNGTKRDNYSSKGNVNPATGKEGTRDPDGP